MLNEIAKDVLLILTIITVVFIFLLKIFSLVFNIYKETSFGFRGKLVYADTGRNSRLFLCKVFGLSAKPDFIYKTGRNEFTLVEYKGRAKSIYDSDVAQVIASVIAARAKYNTQKAYVQTDSTKKEIIVNKPRVQLYKEISHLVDMTREIESNKVITQCYPGKIKCKTCSMATHCEQRNNFN
jgi:hypothetical protein